MELNFYPNVKQSGRYILSLLLTLLLVGNGFAVPLLQETSVSGRVTSSEDGEGIPGVNIVVKGTQTGTITDADGRYSVTASGSDAVLVFSSIGFNSQEVPVSGRSTIDISLEVSLATLDEVVVTALGIEREKKSLGYAVGEVKGENLTTVTQENVLSGLVGKVPGVTISQLGGVGSSAMITIRGAKSLSNNQPLFVIDGIPVNSGMNIAGNRGSGNNVDYGNAISDINPDNIESVSVLKGPSAAALYGSRAGNGVILITTKKGKKGQGLGLTFSTSNVFEKPVEFLDFHYKYANGERVETFEEGSAYWSGPELDKGNMEVQWNSPLDANGDPIATELRSYPDNMKNFLETGITTTNNLALSGSTDKAVYRVNIEHMRNNGLIPNTDLKRNSISTSTTLDITKDVRLTTNLNIARTGSTNRPSTLNRGANPLEAVYYFPHADVRELRDYWVPGSEGIQQRSVHEDFNNPYFLAYELTNGFQRDRAFGNVRLDVQLTPQLSVFGRLSHDFSNENRETKIPMSYTGSKGGGYHLQDISTRETNADFLVTYKKEVNPDLDFSVSAGGNYMIQRYADNYTGSQNGSSVLTIPGLYRLNNIPSNLLVANNFASRKAINSVYGMASIGYKGMLYLDLTARNDWSSTLPESNRSYFYPSASLSWLANYTFDLPQVISLLKLRGGWAQSGNDTDPYRLVSTLGTGSWGSLITTNVPEGLLNPQLKSELQTSREFGLDLNLFNGRVRLEATYYSLDNENQIFPVSTASSSGFKSRLINAGTLTSKGWELVIGGTPVQSASGFTFDINVNVSRNRTVVTDLPEGMDYYTFWDNNNGGSFAREGDQVGNLYSRGYAQVEDPTSPYYRWPIIESGEWVSVNDFNKREKVGNYNPKALVGIQPTITYKRFSLSASFDWRIGGQFQSYSYRYGESDWKSQRQIDALINPNDFASPAELAAFLKSDPEKYIIPQNGNFPRVGGYTSETGGMTNPNDGSTDNGFVPGVTAVYDGDGNVIGYNEHLGEGEQIWGEDGDPSGPHTWNWYMTWLYPWSYNKHITFDADFIKLRELALTYNLPQVLGLRNTSISLFTRNIMLWNKADIGIDPERAFQYDNGLRQGIEFQNVMPWTVSYGFKLNLGL